MPTYDYKCKSCGHTWEKFQSMSAAPEKKCPECGKNTAQRLIGIGAGVIFKGGGFYETDYRDGKYAADAKKDSGSTEGGGEKAGDKPATESKPAAETKPAAEKKPAAETKPAAKKDKPAKPAKTDTKK